MPSGQGHLAYKVMKVEENVRYICTFGVICVGINNGEKGNYWHKILKMKILCWGPYKTSVVGYIIYMRTAFYTEGHGIIEITLEISSIS